MCGIAGFCNRQKTWREDMERMKEQLISRGPDAEGSWCNDSQDVTTSETFHSGSVAGRCTAHGFP